MKTTLFLLIVISLLICGCSTKPIKTELSDFTSLYQKATGKPETLVFASYKTTMIANGEDEALFADKHC